MKDLPIEIRSKYIYFIFVQNPVDVVRHPIERFWIAQVEEPLIRVGCVEHPFRMFSGDRVFGGDPLWLEPENRFDSFAVRMFANGANSAGKTIGNRLPLSKTT